VARVLPSGTPAHLRTDVVGGTRRVVERLAAEGFAGFVLLRTDCIAVLVVDVGLGSFSPARINLHSEGEICGFLSRLVASQTATLPTPFAYLTFRTTLLVRNGIQPEAHSPTRYLLSDG
jgi:hypothetical protein